MRSSPRTAPRRYVPPRSTSVPAVLEAALRIADNEGLEALSMRRLAEDLGIGAMTLYRYVATKDELFDKMVIAVLGDLGCAPGPRLSWQQQLTEVTAALHDKLRTHPGVTEIILTRALPTPAFDRYRESILAILRGAGFPVETAVDALTSLTCYAIGYAHVERVRRDENHDRSEARRLTSLSPQQYPHLVEAAAVYPGHLRARAFDTGLAQMLDGLERQRVSMVVNKTADGIPRNSHT